MADSPASPSPAAGLIAVRINGEQKNVPAGLYLGGLIDFLHLDKNRVAIEYNREIVKRPRWQSVALREGDSLEIVQFVGGG